MVPSSPGFQTHHRAGLSEAPPQTLCTRQSCVQDERPETRRAVLNRRYGHLTRSQPDGARGEFVTVVREEPLDRHGDGTSGGFASTIGESQPDRAVLARRNPVRRPVQLDDGLDEVQGDGLGCRSQSAEVDGALESRRGAPFHRDLPQAYRLSHRRLSVPRSSQRLPRLPGICPAQALPRLGTSQRWVKWRFIAIPIPPQLMPPPASTHRHRDLFPALPVDPAGPELKPGPGCVLERDRQRPPGGVPKEPERQRLAAPGDGQARPAGREVVPARFAEVVGEFERCLGSGAHLLFRGAQAALAEGIVDAPAAQLPMLRRGHGIHPQIADWRGRATQGKPHEAGDETSSPQHATPRFHGSRLPLLHRRASRTRRHSPIPERRAPAARPAHGQRHCRCLPAPDTPPWSRAAYGWSAATGPNSVSMLPMR